MNKYEFKFLCRECGEHKATTRYREAGEKIEHWMNMAVRTSMTKTHNRNSPNCEATHFDLYLGIKNHTQIGMRTMQ